MITARFTAKLLAEDLRREMHHDQREPMSEEWWQNRELRSGWDLLQMLVLHEAPWEQVVQCEVETLRRMAAQVDVVMMDAPPL